MTIIHLKLTSNILCKFIKNMPQNHTLSWLMIWLYQQIIHYDLEKSFKRIYNNHGNQ